ncbi:MAG: nicotinamide mononucleotide transporter [Burkholderiaceae bacterium]|nr:nicotinamide mononucleotide transporter [Burkholderiaceae bacterium]
MEALLQGLQPILAAAFTLWGSPVTWLEITAFALAIWMVICNMRVNPLAWPLAIVSSLLYFLLFWSAKLYGDASLQIVFVVVAFWGWWQWLRGHDASGQALRVRSLGPRGRLIALLSFALSWPAIGFYLSRYTDTDVPFWDAFPTAGSLVGQWLLGRKYVENWPAWIAVNTVGVALFAYKGLWLTVVLYALFTLMAAFGWRAWMRMTHELR